MNPITFSVGLERYLLVRRGTTMEHGEERVSGARAFRILEPQLRSNSALVRQLAAALRLHGEDRVIADRLIANLRAHGSVGGNLVLMRERPAAAPRVSSGPIECVAPPEPLVSEPEPVCEDEPEEDPPPARTSIRVSIFFDGTANNRSNTLDRLNHRQAFVDHHEDDSFTNDYTNVSRLEQRYIGDSSFEHSISIYVEGAGTANHQGDDGEGLGLGTGETGVDAKCNKGIRAVTRSIRDLHLASGTIIERLHLDAFGFSRGAATARYYVHKVLHDTVPLRRRIENGGHTVEDLVINFIGLFDTVASYGVAHYNDTSDLSLDAIRVARKVVHIAAGEEHRKNFRLTNIASAINAGVGIELFFPGVHSDIGGGYTDNYTERELQMLDFDDIETPMMTRRFERERQWLIDTGWYHAGEIAAVNFWNELRVTRSGIRNRYTRIPMRHMAAFASQTGLAFDSIVDHYPILASLDAISATIDAHVQNHLAGTTSTAAHWMSLRTAEHKTLRHDHLHFSAFYGATMGANDPQWTNDDVWHGTRQRVVQAG